MSNDPKRESGRRKNWDASGDSTDPEALFDDPMREAEEEDDSFDEAVEKPQPMPRDPADIIQALNEENTELKNKVLSVLADMENLRRRTEREIKDARQYAVANFARDMLAVSDNLFRALQAIPADARAGADETLKNLLEGVELTDRDLQNKLTKNGVMKLSPEGEKFDPNFHQAMFEVQNPDVPNGTVVQVMQDGYKIGDRVLRPAMVGVSRGGPKGVAGTEAKEAERQDPGVTIDRTV